MEKLKILILVGLLAAGVLSQDLTDLGDGERGGRIRKQFIQDEFGTSRGYSQAVVVDDLESGIRHVFLAGQTFTGNDTLEGQIRGVWDRIELILDAAGGKLSDLVTMTSMIRDLTGAKNELFTQIRVEILGRTHQRPIPYPASMLLGGVLARDFILVEMQTQAMYPIPKHWKVKPLRDSRLEDSRYNLPC